jgi:hypothetical protein
MAILMPTTSMVSSEFLKNAIAVKPILPTQFPKLFLHSKGTFPHFALAQIRQ